MLEVLCCVGLVSSIERGSLEDHTEESIARKKERAREREKKGGSRVREEGGWGGRVEGVAGRRRDDCGRVGRVGI